jgi:hypothetical protein
MLRPLVDAGVDLFDCWHGLNRAPGMAVVRLGAAPILPAASSDKCGFGRGGAELPMFCSRAAVMHGGGARRFRIH